ncbi:MAG: histidinol-phosphate transaminase [Bacteroidales bacterium]
MEIKELVRPNIRALKPYSSARSEFTGNASVFLDANENPFDNGYNRYPDPLQRGLKEQIALIKRIAPEYIFLGNGSDEAIDLVYRIFCIPGQDNVVAPEPTYGMYQVCAEINDIEYRPVPLSDDFSLDTNLLLAATDANTKVVFLCSPNNPTGNLLDKNEIMRVLDQFKGIVVVDEAYIDFADQPSFLSQLSHYPRLIVLQTFSKAWAQASIRLGIAFAQPEIIGYFNKVKYPYNINLLTQSHALDMLLNEKKVKEQVQLLIQERESLAATLKVLPYVLTVYPSQANFLLVRVKDANKIYYKLTEAGVIVRNRNNITLCNGCLRITIGTEAENTQLLNVLKKLN